MTTQLVNVSIPAPDNAPMRAAEVAFDWAYQFPVDSPESYSCAADELKAMKRQTKDLDALRKSLVKPLDEARARIQMLFTPALDYLARAEKIIGRKMLDYRAEEQRAAQAAARAEAERLRQQQEADAALAEMMGEDEIAEDLREQDIHVPIAAAPTAEGTWTVTRWHAELIDIEALCAAVAAGTAPVDLVQINQAAANRLAMALKGAVKYPGVRFVSTESLAVRA